MENLTIFAWTGVVIIVCCFFLMLLAILKGRKSKFNYLLVFLILAMVFWGIGVILIGTVVDPQKALLSWKIAHIGVIFIPPTLFHFFLTFIKKTTRLRNFFILLIYFLAFCFLFLNFFTDLFLRNVTFMFESFYYDVPPTPLYLVFMLYFFTTTFVCFVIAFYDYKDSTSLQKIRMKYVLYSAVIASIGGGFNFLPLLGIEIYPVLNFLLIFYPIGVTYATFKYKILDINLAFREILKYLLIFFITIFLLFRVLVLFENEFDIKIIFSVDTILFLIVFFIIFKFIDYFISNNRRLNELFSVSSIALFKVALEEFRKKDFFYKTFKNLEDDLEYVFCKKWFMQKACIYEIRKLEKFPYLINFLEKYKEKFVRQESDFFEKNQKIESNIDELGDIFIPLFDWKRKKLLAVFILKKNKNDIYFSDSELNLVNSSIGHISLAYQILYYNKNLKREIKEKTESLIKKTSALRLSNKKLKELDKTKDNFLAMASHELRTPITIIKGYTDFLLSNDFGKLNKKQSEFISYIQDSSNGLLLLINDILNLSKIEANRIEFEYEEINLKQYFVRIFNEFKVKAKQGKIDFTYSIDPKLPKYIILDKQKVRLILINLLGNAFKFTQQKKNINVSIRKSKNMLILEVKDQGIGIDENDFEKVFEKFGQIQSFLQKNYEGTGLGLSIVKKIIEKMNGKIYFESKVGKGSTFTVKLPIIRKY